MRKTRALLLCLVVVCVPHPVPAAPASGAAARLARYEAAEALAKAHLAMFGTLDFEVISRQAWERLAESHSKDVVVHWPDGRETRGLEAHVQDLKRMFVYAPDTHVKAHAVEIGSGGWTSVIGITEGTFTEPMPTASGTPIPPTGKSFRLVISTVGHWKDGVMDEEYLFWDTQSFLKQVGLAH